MKDMREEVGEQPEQDDSDPGKRDRQQSEQTRHRMSSVLGAVVRINCPEDMRSFRLLPVLPLPIQNDIQAEQEIGDRVHHDAVRDGFGANHPTVIDEPGE